LRSKRRRRTVEGGDVVCSFDRFRLLQHLLSSGTQKAARGDRARKVMSSLQANSRLSEREKSVVLVALKLIHLVPALRSFSLRHPQLSDPIQLNPSYLFCIGSSDDVVERGGSTERRRVKGERERESERFNGKTNWKGGRRWGEGWVEGSVRLGRRIGIGGAGKRRSVGQLRREEREGRDARLTFPFRSTT